MAFRAHHQLETRIVRIFNTFGPRMRLNDGRVLPTFIGQALQSKPLTAFGDGSQTRSFTYVDDLIEGIFRLLQSEYANPVNIGNPQEVSINEFAHEILQLTQSSSPITYKALPEDDPKQRKPDISLAKKLLNWQPQFSRAKGLKITIESFKSELNPKNNFFSIKETYTSSGQNFVVLEKAEKDLLFKKIISYKNEDYFISVTDKVLNLSVSEITFAPFSKIDRSSVDLDADENSIFNPASFAYLGPAFQTSNVNYNKISFSDLTEESFRELSTEGWVSMLEHYFISAIVPEEGSNFIFQARKSTKSDVFSIGLVGETKSISPNKEASFNQKVYFGPKIKKELQKAHPELDLAVDYGWLWWIGQPMYSAMSFFHDLTGNWGWSIVLVTILIKILLWPLSMVSYRNMGKMRAVQPKMQEIQERHADDRQALSKAMMDLYKKEKVNPALGCLPMLMQMPFFLAFYWVLIETVELRYAPFLFWITDLSARDPLFILPILNMAAMWGMQQLQPQPVGADPIQANVFKYMPLIFGVLFALFPAGLVLYWFLNSLVSAVQMVMHGPKKAKASA